MNTTGNIKYKKIEQGLLLTALVLVGANASAAEYWLCAGSTTLTMPDTNEVINMWGYASDDDNDLSNGCGNAVQIPGPALEVLPGDPALTINLRNDLSEDVSIVISGQNTTMTPVMFTDADGRQRVRSFTHVTAPGATGVYSWNNFKAGTYLYQSGTHPAVQVQMGLYGSVVKDEAAGLAYAGVAYQNDAIMLYSEIDPALHTAKTNGDYGTAAYPSTIYYQPRYFLINGEPYHALSSSLANLTLGETTLIRMLNAGLQSHVPTLQTHVDLIAEDGNKYPYAKTQYSVLLAAGKTMDALFTPAAEGQYSIVDAGMNITNTAGVTGGMLAFLDVSAATGAPVAGNDSYSVVEDGSHSEAAPGVLVNDTGSASLTAVLTSAVTTGTLTLNADGSFDYTPPADFAGGASFSYVANDGVTDSNVVTVSISVTPVNDVPVVVSDAYSTNQNTTLNVAAPGVLSNDSDVDGDTLQAVIQNYPLSGNLVLATDGSFVYVPNSDFVGEDSFSYVADDGAGSVSSPTAVSITVAAAANVAPVANDDAASTVKLDPVNVNLVANDTDIDGTIDPATIIIVTAPLKGVVVVNGDGSVTYTSNRARPGSDAFSYVVSDNDGAVSNTAIVRITVLRR